jgi:hypothetical protein
LVDVDLGISLSIGLVANCQWCETRDSPMIGVLAARCCLRLYRSPWPKPVDHLEDASVQIASRDLRQDKGHLTFRGGNLGHRDDTLPEFVVEPLNRISQ